MRPSTVLLVEDEADTREMLSRALEREGYRCVPVRTTDEALEIARTQRAVDIVVTDVVLGRDDRGGLRLLTGLQAAGVEVPVVVITAYADVEKVKFALNHGAVHFLEKPFRARELVDVLERVQLRPAAPHDTALAVLARARLTDKERVVALHVLEGLSSSEIAEVEHNSPKTIRQHVSQIYAKCGVGNRAEFFRLVYSGRG